MRVTTNKSIPARYAFEAAEGREEGWGRIERLTPLGARLVTRFRLEEADRVTVAFEAAGEAFERLPARVERAAVDEDGYTVAELRFGDEVESRRLGSALRGFVVRAKEGSWSA